MYMNVYACILYMYTYMYIYVYAYMCIWEEHQSKQDTAAKCFENTCIHLQSGFCLKLHAHSSMISPAV